MHIYIRKLTILQKINTCVIIFHLNNDHLVIDWSSLSKTQNQIFELSHKTMSISNYLQVRYIIFWFNKSRNIAKKMVPTLIFS